MNIVGAVIIYLLVWWVTFFTVLPWNIKGVWQNPEAHMRGVDQGAPEDPQMKLKFIRTTWISAIVWLLVVLFIQSGIVDFRAD